MKKNRMNSTKQNRSMGEVRIIAGLWRGRKLPVLNAEGLRPTTDRVKETLFNWLMNDVVGSRCLDCFAGSGSLGIEALSRQAQAVVFLEKRAEAATILKRNLQALHTEKGQAVHIDSLQFLAQKNSAEPFDLVFIDPPFHCNLVPQILGLLQQNQWVKSNSLIYIETEKSHPPLILPTSWQQLKEKTAGQVLSQLIRVR